MNLMRPVCVWVPRYRMVDFPTMDMSKQSETSFCSLKGETSNQLALVLLIVLALVINSWRIRVCYESDAFGLDQGRDQLGLETGILNRSTVSLLFSSI